MPSGTLGQALDLQRAALGQAQAAGLGGGTPSLSNGILPRQNAPSGGGIGDLFLPIQQKMVESYSERVVNPMLSGFRNQVAQEMGGMPSGGAYTAGGFGGFGDLLRNAYAQAGAANQANQQADPNAMQLFMQPPGQAQSIPQSMYSQSPPAPLFQGGPFYDPTGRGF